MIIGSLIINTPDFKVYHTVVETNPPQDVYTAVINGTAVRMTYEEIREKCAERRINASF